ncbi:MAG: phosphodiester glycosidase family protein [Planctomycetota bacterium]
MFRPMRLSIFLWMMVLSSSSIHVSIGLAQDKPQESWRLPTGVGYEHIVRKEPRPLHIHVLQIDTQAPDLSFDVAAGDDPDGDGPAEVALAHPRDLAKKVNAIAAINTSAWAMLTDPQTGKKPGYIVGGAADISGWVSQADRLISPPQGGYWSVWMDASKRIKIGTIASKEELQEKGVQAKWAVSGFRGILKDSQVLVEPSQVRHPRTAVGLSKDGNQFVWMVVDGRQQGYSEGVSEEELAKLLIERGCSEGINLDGGGSSSMWIRNDKDELSVANSPSEKTGVRPVPVVLSLIRDRK